MEISDLNSEMLVECLKLRKDELHYTNAQISERSGVPESTVTKVFNGTNRSPTFDTIAPIARVLGVSLDTLIASDDAQHVSIKTVESCDNGSVQFIAYIIASSERRIRLKDRWICVLAALLIIILGLMISFTAYDFTHPEVGWARLSAEYLLRQ